MTPRRHAQAPAQLPLDLAAPAPGGERLTLGVTMPYNQGYKNERPRPASLNANRSLTLTPVGGAWADNNPIRIFSATQTRLTGRASFFVGRVSVATSALQDRAKKRLRVLFSQYEIVENFRPDWLCNPETGRNLEIDLYFPTLKIGVEIQGGQHLRFTPHFHLTQQDFEKQQARDAHKKAVCLDRGVALYEVFSVDDIDHFIERLHERHEKLSYELFQKFAAMRTLSYLAANLHIEHKQKDRDPARMDSLMRRILNICERYSIPPATVKPDFTIRKTQVAYMGKTIVHAIWNKSDTVHAQGAVLEITDNIATVRLIEEKFKAQEIKFDIQTGAEVGQDGHWRLSDNSLRRITEPSV